MQNWTNDTSIFFLAMIVLLIGMQCNFLRTFGESYSKKIDDIVDEIERDFGFTEQDFNKKL